MKVNVQWYVHVLPMWFSTLVYPITLDLLTHICDMYSQILIEYTNLF